jgi:hypothetical protein
MNFEKERFYAGRFSIAINREKLTLGDFHREIIKIKNDLFYPDFNLDCD